LTAQDIDYQDWFVKECLRAMNEFENNYPFIAELGEEGFMKRCAEKKKAFPVPRRRPEENERSTVRCVGITFEPRRTGPGKAR